MSKPGNDGELALPLTPDEIKYCDEVAMRVLAAMIAALGRDDSVGGKYTMPMAYSCPEGDLATSAYDYALEMLKERRELLALPELVGKDTTQPGVWPNTP